MKRVFLILTLAVLAIAHPVFGNGNNETPDETTAQEPPPVVEPEPVNTVPVDLSMVEVVFVLDSTGSMGELIEGAKAKIWSIANSVVELELAPEGRIGLVSYRDRGDQYVTRTYDLTDDLDSAFRNLQSFIADGGGDWPESVNEALLEAVHRMSWTPGPEVLRIVFLVGDAPPQMGYRNDILYPVICRDAVQKGIIINTIQCGADAETTDYWMEIAEQGRGEYVMLAQSGNMTVIETPYDDEILALSAELNKTVVPYGSPEMQVLTRDKLLMSETASAGAAADCAAFNLSTGGKIIQGTGDLVADLKSGLADLGRLDASSLPMELRTLNRQQILEYLDRVNAERDRLNFQLADLSGDRTAYIHREQERLAVGGQADAFDTKVSELLEQQAGRGR